MTGIMNKYVSTPSLISFKGEQYLIMDAPTDENLEQYLKELKEKGVTMLVRTCEPSYSIKKLNEAGISVTELPFPDGASPPGHIVTKWLAVIKNVFEKKGENPTVAIHCVAGLGRAPAMVAIALIEKGMDPMDAIQKIRNKRRGAINKKQVKFLMDYQRQGGDMAGCCSLM